jgi:hypothetical protein
MRKLSASDRSALIKLASRLPAGSSERKSILARLGKVANVKTMVEGLVSPGGSPKSMVMYFMKVLPRSSTLKDLSYMASALEAESGKLKGALEEELALLFYISPYQLSVYARNNSVVVELPVEIVIQDKTTIPDDALLGLMDRTARKLGFGFSPRR